MNGDFQKLLNSMKNLIENEEDNKDLDLSLGNEEDPDGEGEGLPSLDTPESQTSEDGQDPDIQPDEDPNMQDQMTNQDDQSSDTISTSREEIMKVVDQGIKSGQKVHIIIGSEGKDPTIEIANAKKGKKEVVNKKGAPKKNVEPSNEMNSVVLQTLSLLANKVAELNDKVNPKVKAKGNATDEKKVQAKKNVMPTNEDVLYNQIEGLTLKISEMEARLAAKDSIGYFTESYDSYNDQNFAELSNALDEAYEGINSLIESIDVIEEQENRLNTVYQANVLSKVLLECNNRFVVPFKMGVNNLNNAILSEVAEIESNIKSDLEQQINEALDSFSKIMTKVSIAEKINAMDLNESVKSDIINLIEQSQMSETSDGYDDKYAKESNAITAPEYIDSKFNNGTVKQSQISDANDGYSNKSMNVFKLPVKKNFDSSKVTINSAISAIAESFTNEDGKLDVNQVQHAFLYQKKSHPKSLDDFAIPLATIVEGKLVAVPKFIEFAAKTLINESKCHIYGIPGSDLETLRSKILPYLNELNIAAPWDN